MMSSSRGGARVIWVAVHTAEGARTAEDLRAYFARSTTSSAHAVADDTTLLQSLVPYDRAAWTLRNGNARSDNLELCGFADWTRDEWIEQHGGMLHAAATWIRSRCKARGIPIRKLTPAQVGAGWSGVIGHVDYTNGTGDGTHWDPGPGFPWDIVMALARGETVALDNADKDYIFDQINRGLRELAHGNPDVAHNRANNIRDTKFAVGTVLAAVNALTAKVDAGFANLSDDEATIVAAVREIGVIEGTDEQLAAIGDRLGEHLATVLPAAVLDAMTSRLQA